MIERAKFDGIINHLFTGIKGSSRNLTAIDRQKHIVEPILAVLLYIQVKITVRHDGNNTLFLIITGQHATCQFDDSFELQYLFFKDGHDGTIVSHLDSGNDNQSKCIFSCCNLTVNLR